MGKREALEGAEWESYKKPLDAGTSGNQQLFCNVKTYDSH